MNLRGIGAQVPESGGGRGAANVISPSNGIPAPSQRRRSLHDIPHSPQPWRLERNPPRDRRDGQHAKVQGGAAMPPARLRRTTLAERRGVAWRRRGIIPCACAHGRQRGAQRAASPASQLGAPAEACPGCARSRGRRSAGLAHARVGARQAAGRAQSGPGWELPHSACRRTGACRRSAGHARARRSSARLRSRGMSGDGSVRASTRHRYGAAIGLASHRAADSARTT